MRPYSVLLPLLCVVVLTDASTSDNYAGGAAGVQDEDDDLFEQSGIKIAKCCEPEEIYMNGHCVPLKETNETKPWKPLFESEDSYEGAKPVKEPKYVLKYGMPLCANNEKQWDVYASEHDKLVMMTNGNLRHYAKDQVDEHAKAKELYGMQLLVDEEVQAKAIHKDYPFGHYCLDKVIQRTQHSSSIATYARICIPNPVKWANTDSLMKKAIDPAFHAIAIVSYLIVAIVYFVLPQLRDLVGNIITSMTLCLIVNQSASLVRIFTEFGNHISFLAAESIMHISILAAFFWLNALGYYVWNTFRSRNVFLRSTDKKKYFWYSIIVWGSTIAIAATAIFAHFTLETNKPKIGGVAFIAQETIGWLGLSVLFTSVGFTIIIDLCFVLTTINKLKRMRTYGRIHHKMKYSFRMFILIYGIMSVGWLSLLFSLMKYDGLIYCHIIINALQAVLILYVCVFGQKRVTFLLGKTCNCCTSTDNNDNLDWGEEMTAINAGY